MSPGRSPQVQHCALKACSGLAATESWLQSCCSVVPPFKRHLGNMSCPRYTSHTPLTSLVKFIAWHQWVSQPTGDKCYVQKSVQWYEPPRIVWHVTTLSQIYYLYKNHVQFIWWLFGPSSHKVADLCLDCAYFILWVEAFSCTCEHSQSPPPITSCTQQINTFGGRLD